jgi:UDP-arabinose 4-epimerase
MKPSRRILVTGGAGFIGSHACKLLFQSGYEPVVVDNLSTGHRRAVKWGPLIECDLRQTDVLTDMIVAWDISTVIHFAASAYVGESVRDPEKYYGNNVGGLLSLLKACRATSVGRVIFSSSCATYGNPLQLPVSETCAQIPISPYGRTKLVCEQILQDYQAAYGLHHVSLRYFNACGADHDGALVEDHRPETHLLPRALLAAAGARSHLDIYGTDYDTPDGTAVRDYIHVEDLARGHVMALRYLEAGGSSQAVNLGSGQGHSVLDVLAVIREVTGRQVPVQYSGRRPGDPPLLVADPALAQSVLGFVTTRSDLATIVADAAPSFGAPRYDPVAV